MNAKVDTPKKTDTSNTLYCGKYEWRVLVWITQIEYSCREVEQYN